MWLSLFFSVLPANQRQAVWETDLKAGRGGSSVGQTGLLLGDSLFSKELENMGKQLAGRHLCVHGCMCAVCAYTNVCVFISSFNDECKGLKSQIHTVVHTEQTLNCRDLWTRRGLESTYEEWEAESPAKECTAFGQRDFLA